VDDSGLVCGLKRIGDLQRHFQDLGAEKRFARDHVLEGLPLQQLHHDEGLTLELVNFVNRANVGVIETGSGPRFALKSLQGLRVADKLGWEELQGDASPQSEIQSAVDNAHTAAAQFFFDPVMRDDLAQHRSSATDGSW
jgi:hypothetical protein